MLQMYINIFKIEKISANVLVFSAKEPKWHVFVYKS